MKNFFELSARYDARASFYGKAHVIINDDNSLTLRSYETDILTIDESKRTFTKLYGEYSHTTNRHIQEFAKQYHLPITKWSDFDKLEMNKEINY